MKIVEKSSKLNSLCSKKDFHLFSSNGLNNRSSILLLPANLPHNIQLSKSCLKKDLIYSSYLIQINSMIDKSTSNVFHEQFIEKICSQNQSKFSFTIEENSLPIGSYLYHLTIIHPQSNEMEHYIQPIEIFQSNIIKKIEEKVNYTLLCYPQLFGKDLFSPNGLEIGEYDRFNQFILWERFQLVDHRSELNFNFYENECLSFSDEIHSFIVDPQTREMFINEKLFNLNNRTLYFDLIKDDLISGKVLITRRILNGENEKNLMRMENVLDRLDDLILQNDPNEAINVIDDLVGRLNELSETPVRYFYIERSFSNILFSIEFSQ